MSKKIFISTSSFGKYSNVPIDFLKDQKFKIKKNKLDRKIKKNELLKLISDFDGIIAGTETYDSEILNKGVKLKVISRVGVGLDNIDLEIAKKKNIKVYRTPTSPSNAVSELVLVQIINLLRKVPSHISSMKKGIWSKSMGSVLYGKTLGIIGLGQIGKRLVSLLKGFDLNILAYDIEQDKSFAKEHSINYCDINKLFKLSDIVTIHTNMNDNNKNLLSMEQFLMMKSSSIIINTSRGEIINENDLQIAIEKKLIAGAALDVYQIEPYNGPFEKFDNILLTPHIGSYAKEDRIKMEIEAVENLIRGIK